MNIDKLNEIEKQTKTQMNNVIFKRGMKAIKVMGMNDGPDRGMEAIEVMGMGTQINDLADILTKITTIKSKPANFGQDGNLTQAAKQTFDANVVAPFTQSIEYEYIDELKELQTYITTKHKNKKINDILHAEGIDGGTNCGTKICFDVLRQIERDLRAGDFFQNNGLNDLMSIFPKVAKGGKKHSRFDSDLLYW